MGPTPAPPAPPPPPQSASVTIFQDPTVGEYAGVGASIGGPGGNLDTYSSLDDRFGDVSSASSDQAHVRYTSAGQYEVKLPPADWDRLVPYEGLANPGPDNNYFQPAGAAMNSAYLVTSNSRNSGYDYSELASWGSAEAHRWGYTAFGVATPDGGVPTTGTATYQGSVSGSADIMSADYLYGGVTPAGVSGDVALNFNFGAGELDGTLSLSLWDGASSVSLGTFGFTDTVFSAGSTAYSGRFDTNVAGDNFFLGRFTGPHAEETIGAWAVPFKFDSGTALLPADHGIHQAFGAWIAKRP